MSDCPRFGKMLGCKFKARYDEIEHMPEGMRTGSCYPPFIEAIKTKKKTYVCDICVRCGKRLDRNGK